MSFGLMKALFDPLRATPRALLLVAAFTALGALRLPLWTMSFQSNQYPDPLQVSIYADHLEGARTASRDDLKEVNSLNHYIGMRELTEHDFAEFSWLPLALIAVALLVLRTAALGSLRDLVDMTVVLVLFGGYSMWTFWRRLYEYGHELAPGAAITVSPFTPPVFGRTRIANFWVESYPGWGAALVGASALLVLVALGIAAWRSWPRTATAQSPSPIVLAG